MKTIDIAYDCMWGESHLFPADYLIQCFPYLRGHCRFRLSERPQLAFHSVYGYVRNRHDGATRVLYAGEAGDHFGFGGKLAPGIQEAGFYHFGITCAADQSHPNHCYMPAGFLHLNLYNHGVATLIRDGSPPPRKELFCNFVYSNGHSQDRIVFFQKLSQYRRIESCGHVCRNNDSLARSAYCQEGYLQKQAFQARCKFSIAMENSYFPGYNTEKITDPFVARSVPIYKGDPRIAEWFNPRAFINIDNFRNDDEAIDYIKAVDNDDALYESLLNEPPFVGNVVPEPFMEKNYLAFWQRVLG